MRKEGVRGQAWFQTLVLFQPHSHSNVWPHSHSNILSIHPIAGQFQNIAQRRKLKPSAYSKLLSLWSTCWNCKLLVQCLWILPIKLMSSNCHYQLWSKPSLLFLAHSLLLYSKFKMTDPGFDRVGKIGSDGNPLVRINHFIYYCMCGSTSCHVA